MAVDVPAARACVANFNSDPAIQAHTRSGQALKAAEAAHKANPGDQAAKDRYEAALDHHADRSIGTVASQFALEECLERAGVQMGVRAGGPQPRR